MKADWKSFLIENGAEFTLDDESKVASYGNPEVEPSMAMSGNVICDLSHSGLIEVHGADSRAFLQGQTTNNLSEISEHHSTIGSYCSPKGRIMASFRMFQRKDTFYLSLARDLLPATLKRLRMFVLMSKVTLEDANDALVRFGISGPKMSDELEKLLGGCPQQPDEVLQSGDLSVIRVRGAHPRFMVFGSVEACRTLWERLNVNCAPVGAAAWDLLDIRAGVPHIVSASWEMFVPQMVNLQRLDGVSFKKGCYTGQEVVARMHYLGKLKRRMYRAEFDTDALPEPGAALFGMENGELQAAGNIVNAVASPDGGIEALAVIIIRFIEDGIPLRLGSGEGPVARLIEDPPYGFEAEKS